MTTWTAVDDICWMRCDRPGFMLVRDAYEIVLCAEHRDELEATAQVKGYSQARRPKDRTVSWWPWRRIEALVVRSDDEEEAGRV